MSRREDDILADDSLESDLRALAHAPDEPISSPPPKTLAPGTRFGHYEILSPLGRGGMGEVYRARDTRLGRNVALKVLPSALRTDPGRIRRIELEARAASALNHPNIVAVYDFDTQDGAPYVASELLEGSTLRQLLASGPLPVPKAIDHAVQVARGLAAAHAKKVVHRDIKPENLFVTSDGRVKILDFGLAKLAEPFSSDDEHPRSEHRTATGTIIGTAGYMSPEQVRGEAVDQRSDLFSFGVVLHEMLTGERLFRGNSAVETMNAILTQGLRPIRGVPRALERIVGHCLEKNPEDRCQSARDVAFELEAFSGVAISSSRRRLPSWIAFGIASLAIAWGGLLSFTRGAAPLTTPSFRQLTFRRGFIGNARFTQDGRNIVYGAGWDGRPCEVFAVPREGGESRPLGIGASDVLAVSKTGELAVSLDRRFPTNFSAIGRLARSRAEGGSPLEVLDRVTEADWSPDGRLAVVHDRGSIERLEYPIGNVLYETSGRIGRIRFSPRGDRIAFEDCRRRWDDGCAIAVIDLAGSKRALTDAQGSQEGLAWSADGGEIWFAATPRADAVDRFLQAVSLSGKVRTLLRIPGPLTLEDISRDGRVLLTKNTYRAAVWVLPPGEQRERDLSWFEASFPRDLSSDGRTLLLQESGSLFLQNFALYLRETNGSGVRRIGEGIGHGLSPNGKWVLATSVSASEILVYPSDGGPPRPIARGAALSYERLRWFPDSRHFLALARGSDDRLNLYVQDIEGGKPRSISPAPVSLAEPRTRSSPAGRYSTEGAPISPDGKLVAAMDAAGRTWLLPIDGGEAKLAEGINPGELPIQWTARGQSLFVLSGRGDPTAKIYQVDPHSGRRQMLHEIGPADPAGEVSGIQTALITPNGQSYAYRYLRVLSDLYVADGIK